MSRSNWKGSYINNNYKLIKKFQKLKKIDTSHNALIVNRNSEIVPRFVGLTFKVHNGKNFTNLLVLDEMVGHKFGEFCSTRVRFIFKKKKLKK